MATKKYIAITSLQEKEIRLKWKTLSNDQLYNHLVENFGYQGSKTTMRTYMYDNNMKKTNMMRWTDKETQFLLDNYKTKGNTEIAKKLSKKNRVVTKKNVEKKLRLLKISRTPEEIKAIINNNVKSGIYSKANFKKWEGIKIQEGKTVIQISNGRPIVMIKINETLTPYARHRWIELNGIPEPGMRVHFKDCNPLNVEDDNLELRKGCSYSGLEIAKYNRFCREYIIKNKIQEEPVVSSEPKKQKDVYQGLITVRINSKTVIQVKPGTNIEALRQRYSMESIISNSNKHS